MKNSFEEIHQMFISSLNKLSQVLKLYFYMWIFSLQKSKAGNRVKFLDNILK